MKYKCEELKAAAEKKAGGCWDQKQGSFKRSKSEM